MRDLVIDVPQNMVFIKVDENSEVHLTDIVHSVGYTFAICGAQIRNPVVPPRESYGTLMCVRCISKIKPEQDSR